MTSTKIQKFCGALGWSSLEVMIRDLRTILSPEPRKDLVELMTLRHMNSKTAEILVSSGFSTVNQLAAASIEKIAQCLLLNHSFEFQVLLVDNLLEM